MSTLDGTQNLAGDKELVEFIPVPQRNQVYLKPFSQPPSP